MHDIKFFESNTEEVKDNLKKRKVDGSLVDQAIRLNEKRKTLVQGVEANRAQVKTLSQEIGKLKKEGKDDSHIKNSVAEIKAKIESAEADLSKVEKDLNYLLAIIPNLVSKEVPAGNSEADNVKVKSHGTPRTFSFKPKDHVELGEALGMLDFERGARLTGSRFVVYSSHLARLERALINFMLDEHIKHGYIEILPPFIVNSDALFGTGQLPKFSEDIFKLNMPDKDWYLIPTAEVPVTNLKRDEIFSREEFPIKYCAYTPCFRSEAGSHGKDTKGLIRLHQFNKVELVNIVSPEESEKAHDEMVKRASSILEKLGLPYQALLLCGADIGFSAHKCIDLEVWLPGQNRYREISSISNCTDFQARRAGIRFRNAQGKPEFAHTLNGSGLAVGRTLVAILENYQNEDGTITVPEVLVNYMGGIKIISKS